MVSATPSRLASISMTTVSPDGYRAGFRLRHGLPDEQTAAGVERHGAGIPHHGLAGEFHLQLGRNGRKRGDGGRLTGRARRAEGTSSKAARHEPARTISDPLRFRDPAFPRSGACVMEWLVFRGRPIVNPVTCGSYPGPTRSRIPRQISAGRAADRRVARQRP